MTRGDSVPIWQRAVVILSCAVVGLVVVLGLQWGRPILIPVSLAILLTFLLNPIVRTLELRGLGRVFSVMVAVTLAGVMLTCLGWMVTREVADLMSTLPQNTANIKAKVKTIRALGTGHFADQFARMVEEISDEIQRPARDKTVLIEEGQSLTNSPSEVPAGNVQFRTESTFWLRLTGYLGSALEVLATLAFALVLLVFFLIGREDLRDRMVLLAGKAHLALTSKALEDITERIGRYILVVAMINGSFGILLTVGLLALGVPYALLWGFLAAVLRFLPYIGPWVGAGFPIVMSLATFEGWWQPIAVLGYFMILELTIGNIVEPYVFGHSTGVSPTALLISAAFWLYLWGPIGLVFSAPFAVCLVVLGKNIEQLGFLNLLLGDLPALRANVGIYQRLMLGDEHEVVRLVLQQTKDLSSAQVYDNLLVPVLNYTRRDMHRDYLNEDDRKTILRCLRDSLSHVDSYRRSMTVSILNREDSKPELSDDVISDEIKPHVILGQPAFDDIDSVGLEMLGKLLDPSHWNLEVTAETTSTSELLTRMEESHSEVVCISSFPPGGLTHAVAICKRLRNDSSKVLIIVGRWGQKSKIKTDREQLELAGANFVAVTLSETLAWLDSRYPLTQLTPMKAPPSIIPDRVACWEQLTNLQVPEEREGASIMRFLEVSHLRKTFNGSVVAVNDLSFHVDDGEIFGLVGPNGAGKTTTMSMLAGLLKPDRGSICIQGQPFDPGRSEHRALLGMVPQHLAIYPELTANENLGFFGSLYGLRGTRLKQRVDSVLEMTGLTERANSLVKTFSGGMKRRLNFGVAMLHQPRLVILDEPTVGVDPQSRSHLLDAIHQLSDDGVSILYASHYMEEVEAICDRVAILDGGRLMECGTLPELLSNVNCELRLCVSPPSPTLIASLHGLAQVRQSSNEELMITLTLDGHVEHSPLDQQLRHVMDLLNSCGTKLRSIESDEHNLERLFLKLTGNRLRD